VRWADLSEEDVSPALKKVVVETPPHESDLSEADRVITPKIATPDDDHIKLRTRKSERREFKVTKASEDSADVDSTEWTQVVQKKREEGEE